MKSRASENRQRSEQTVNPKNGGSGEQTATARAQPRSQVTSDGNSVPNNRPSTKKTIKRTMFM
jgi:hypothetical protein